MSSEEMAMCLLFWVESCIFGRFNPIFVTD